MSAEGWVLIVGAVGVIITQIVTLILNYLAAQAKEHRDAERAARVAGKVEHVAGTLQESTARTDGKLDTVSEKIEGMKEDIKTIEIATNSMKDALVASTEKEAFARGSKEERERADKEKHRKPEGDGP